MSNSLSDFLLFVFFIFFTLYNILYSPCLSSKKTKKYTLIGGKVNKEDKDIYEAVIRECIEELNVKLEKDFTRMSGNIIIGRAIPFMIPYFDNDSEQLIPLFSKLDGIINCLWYAIISAILSEALVFFALSKGDLSVATVMISTYPIYTLLFSRYINNEILLLKNLSLKL